MQIVLLIARLLLAVVFGVAGIAKAADIAGSRRAVVGFGIPERLASPLGLGLPFAEILIAVALIPLNSAWAGAIAALAVLLIFTIGIAVNLARGNSPDCHCFGQLHSEPVGWSTLARNIVLIAVAGLIAFQGRDNAGLSALAWLGDLKTGEVVSLVSSLTAVALLGVAFVYLRRVISQHATILERIDAMKKVIDEDYAEPRPVERGEAASPSEGLPVGAPAPGFALTSISGAQVSLDDLLSYRKPVLILFMSPGCAPCKALLPMINVWERDHGGSLTVALLSKGTLKDNQDELMRYEAKHMLLQGESEIASEYEAKWTPAAVLVRQDGKIATPLSYGYEDIRAMVDRAVAPAADTPTKRRLEVKGNGHKPSITIGTPHALDDVGKLAPVFSLPDVAGDVVTSDKLWGRDTLLLFWDPKCPYCKAMVEDLERWEQEPPSKAPRLVFVSSGDLEASKAESGRFQSLFLIDPELETGLLFGTHLTPSAVLIDSDGRLASGPTPGRANIMALAGVRKASVTSVTAV